MARIVALRVLRDGELLGEGPPTKSGGILSEGLIPDTEYVYDAVSVDVFGYQSLKKEQRARTLPLPDRE